MSQCMNHTKRPQLHIIFISLTYRENKLHLLVVCSQNAEHPVIKKKKNAEYPSDFFCFLFFCDTSPNKFVVNSINIKINRHIKNIMSLVIWAHPF
jgi:hypothetical protein